MKKLFLLLAVISTILFCTSCESVVTFKEPQPIRTDALSKFPKRIQGNYLSKENTATLTISDNMILETVDYYQKTKLDSNYKVVADTIVNIARNERHQGKLEGDSILEHIHFIDTLFLISTKQILKKFKGYYFLNSQYENEAWYVKKLSLSKGRLAISDIDSEESINLLREVTETTADTTSYNFNPTRKQFKKFVRQEGFNNNESYIRIRD